MWYVFALPLTPQHYMEVTHRIRKEQYKTCMGYRKYGWMIAN